MNATMRNDSVPDTIPESEEEQDEEVRIAMEMAMAAAKNPGLTPVQLRDLVGKKNKQADIVDQIKKEKEQKAKEEAAKKWNDQKESVFSWLSHSITDSKNAIRAAAESLQSSAEQQLYADKIRKNPEVIRLRKKIKHMRKDLKTKRLAGNRVETRHRFKRHRMENNLLSQEEKIEKSRKLFVDTNFGMQEYGKAILRAGRKYKNAGSPEEENLEAMLCRNMHQMLSIDKQKAKMKKSNKEIKKYLQRCQSWITDKQALWEMSMMKLDATHSSMKALYEDTFSRQDKLIKKLKEADDYKGVNLADVDVSYFDEIPKNAGPHGMLCALRGLPFTDSIRVTKSSGGSVKNNGGAKELYIETHSDSVSVSSHLSDPDADFESNLSAETGYGFGDDAPWNLGDSSLSPSRKAAAAAAAAAKGQPSMKEGLSQPPSTITAPIPTVEVPRMKPAPTPPAEKSADDGKPEEPVPSPEEDNPAAPDESSPAPEKESSAEEVNEAAETTEEDGAEEAETPEKPTASDDDKNGAESIETTPCSTDSAED